MESGKGSGRSYFLGRSHAKPAPIIRIQRNVFEEKNRDPYRNSRSVCLLISRFFFEFHILTLTIV